MPILPELLERACEQAIGGPVDRIRSVGGGDINFAAKLESRTGAFFLKWNNLPQAYDMFRTESQGLWSLGQEGLIRTPQVIAAGEAGGFSFLLLEFIDPGRRTPAFWDHFGIALAELHARSRSHFGLSYDNFIGRLPQPNGHFDDFPTFYIEKRLHPQLETARKNNLMDQSDERRMERLYSRLEDLIPVEAPALIHGDLWGGNFLVDATDLPVLIDPAISFAHREMDLAMSRLFGGFDSRFYDAYQAAYPTQPRLEERLEIFQLYYLLAHVNLFGNSYVGAVRRILRQIS